MEKHPQAVEAMLVSGNKIIKLGKLSELKKINNDATLRDLHKQTVLPGFVDAHSHFPGSGLSVVAVDLSPPPVGKVTNIASMIEVLKEKAKETDEGDWVIGFGYDDTMLAQKRHPNRHDLDKVSMKHPIFLLHVSGHLAAMNTAGLVKVNINRKTVNPTGGIIRKFANGEPSGVLEETAKDEIMKEVFDLSMRQSYRIIKKATKDYLSVGITTAQAGIVPQKLLRPLYWATKLGLHPLRLVIWPDVKLARRFAEKDLDKADYDSNFFKVGAVKLIADGSIQGYTAYLSKPYYKIPANKKPNYRGYPKYKRNELIKMVAYFLGKGMPLAIHGNGDAAIDDILAAVEEFQKTHKKMPKLIIVHAQMARKDQLKKMVELGVSATFFSVHTYYWGDRHRKIFLGEHRASKINPLAMAEKLEVKFSIHLDTPVVPMTPLFAAYNATSRQTRSGFILGKKEKINIMRALKALTIDPAWQMGIEKTVGSLVAGKFADFIILNKNPLAFKGDWHSLWVEETFINGKREYKRTAVTAH